MRTIICKKCGAPIDASLGECPICGAVYYILPQDEPDDFTRVWDAAAASEIQAAIEKQDDEYVQPVAPRPAQRPSQPPMQRPAQQPAQRSAQRNVQQQTQPTMQRRAQNGKKPPNRSWVFIVLAVTLLAILTLVLCFMTGVFNFGSNSESMPALVGMNRDLAVNQLRAMDISPHIVYEESTEADGIVIRQSPEAGKSIGKSASVTLTISSGMAASPEPEAYIEVPDVIDQRFENAESRLQSAGLKTIKGSEEFHDTVEEGRVIKQSPLPGAKLQEGGSVTLTVSKGPETKEFNIIATAGKGGSITPSGSVTVKEGESLSFVITPDEGYVLRDVRVDGVSAGAHAQFTIEQINGDRSVYAVFEIAPDEPTPPDETDEPTSSPGETDDPDDTTPPDDVIPASGDTTGAQE